MDGDPVDPVVKFFHNKRFACVRIIFRGVSSKRHGLRQRARKRSGIASTMRRVHRSEVDISNTRKDT